MIQNRKWTEGEREFLRQYYQVYSLSKLAFSLHRTKAAVATQARLMKIRKKQMKRNPRATSEIFIWEFNKTVKNKENETSQKMENLRDQIY